MSYNEKAFYSLFNNTVSQDTDFQTHVSQRICQVKIIGVFFFLSKRLAIF